MEVKVNDIILCIEKDTIEIKVKDKTWKTTSNMNSHILLGNGRSVLFESAKQIERSIYSTKFGKGILTRYRDLKGVNFAFDTLVWIEAATSHLYFEWIPVNDNGFEIAEIVWPLPFEKENNEYYLPKVNGVKLTSDSKEEMVGMFGGKDASMSFLAQCDTKKNAIMILNETYWDAKYHKDSNGLYIGWVPSLGKMNYRRVLRYIFIEDFEEAKLCNIYKEIQKENGNTLTLQKTEVFQKVNLVENAKSNRIQNAEGLFLDKSCPLTLLAEVKKAYAENRFESVILLEHFVDELEECQSPFHKMSRRECIEARNKVITYLQSKGIQVVLDQYVDYVNANVSFCVKENEEENLQLFEKIYKNN